MLAAPAAFAQAPSDKPLRIIAAGPAGGTLDIVSRLLADGLQKELNQTVIVEPKPGAGGALAVNDLMQAPHDGNTVVVSLDAMVSEIPHAVKLRIDMSKEVKPIAELARGGLVMVGNPSVPAKNLAEVIAYVKANPGKVSYASYSAGTVSHVMGLQLNKAAGIDMAHVGVQGLAAGARRRDGRARAADVRRDPELAAADQGRQDRALRRQPAAAFAAAAQCADVHRARLPAARGDALGGPVRHARRAGRGTDPAARSRAEGHGAAGDARAPEGARLRRGPAAHAGRVDEVSCAPTTSASAPC